MRKESVNMKTPNHFDYPATKPTSKLNCNNHQENEIKTEKSRPSDPSAGIIKQRQCNIGNSFIPRLNEQLKPSKYFQYINKVTIGDETTIQSRVVTDNRLKSECNQTTVATNQEKRKLTRRYLVTVLSICYAISLVVFGAIVFIGDAVKTRYPLPQAFCAYMLLVSFGYFLFLYIDIRLHVARIEYKEKVQSKPQQQQVTDYDTSLEQNARKLNLASSKTISHEYCFIMGRHGGSFYLKFGAAWFAFGLLVYSILQISYQIEFISANGNSLYQCASYVTLALDILFPIYSTFTLFFTVKYMNVVINVHQDLARFCLMHAIGTSLTFWVFTIIRETTDAIAKFDVKQYGQTRDHEFNVTFAFVYHDCGKPIALNSIHQQFAPYLFPFIIEYCILNVGVWFTIYRNINRCPKKNSKLETNLSLQSQSHDNTSDHENDLRVSTIVYADCHSSFCGMFAGLLVLTLTFVCIILMFVGVQNISHLNATVSFVTATFELALMIVMSVATILAYTRTIQLDMETTDYSATLDDVLLFIAIPAYVMELVVTMAPAIYYQMFYRACISIASIVQVFIQTAFIVDGLRRCANDSELRKRKPGRELVIFLTITNVSLWVYNTLSVKTALADDERYLFYGLTLWNILDHVSMPLIMFYRFHASVCLVDMWNHAYEPKLH